MFLVLHIAIAIGGMFMSGLSFISPSSAKIKYSYVLTALTVISGTYLIVSRHAAILQACMTGLMYISVNYFAIALAQSKLASETDQDDPEK